MDRDHSRNWDESIDTTADDTEQKPARPLNVRSQFLDKWLNTGESVDEEKEEESDSTKTKKKRRFRKVFKRLFPSIATKEEREPKPITPESFMPPSFELPSSEDPKETETLHDGDAFTISHNDPETRKSVTDSNEEDPAAHIMEYEDMSKHQPDRMAHTTEPRPYVEPEVPLQQVHRDTTIDPSEFINRSNLLERSDELSPSLTAMTPAAAVASPRTETVSPPVETIIEVPNKRARKDALATFLAADFLSRRRDRKLRRELRSTQKTNEKVTEQIQRKQNLADRKIEHIMRKPNVPESMQLPPPPPVITERIIVKPKEVFRAESLSTYRQNQGMEKPKIIEKPPQDLSHKPHPESKNIDRQMESVENRSNQYDPEQEDQTPEAFFDRRHEVMDEATKRPRVVATPAFGYSGGATSIGAVLQNQPRPQISTQMSQSQPPGKQPAIPQDPKLYKQSIQYGIASAMFIVVLAIIAYMVS